METVFSSFLARTPIQHFDSNVSSTFVGNVAAPLPVWNHEV